MNMVDTVRNKDLREKINDKMNQKTLEWFRHMGWMEENRLRRRLYKSGVEISRDRGMPYFFWLDGVESVRKAKHVELGNAKSNWMKG